jgi:hypothetical protein
MEGPHVLGLLLVGPPDASPIGQAEHSFYVALADRLVPALSVAAERQDLARRQKGFRRLAAF